MPWKLVDFMKRGLANLAAIPGFLRRAIVHKGWPIWESLGFHIVPNHFYYPIPDMADLREKKPWGEKYPTAGIDFREKEQLELLDQFSQYFVEYTSSGSPFEANGDGPILYAMVRKFKPQRIIEVGSGDSTTVSLAASKQNERESGSRTEILSIEPNPSERLRKLAKENENLTLLESRAEDVSVRNYTDLDRDDFLFIDSSHTLTIGNDVAHLYLKVLPQLPDGVLVHSHDIRFPSEYPKGWILDGHRFWTEQYILQTFLMFNDAFEVLWSGNHLSDQYPEELERTIPNFTSGGGWPGSFWIRRKEGTQ